MFICLRPRTPYPPPPTYCRHVYSILIYTGKGERGGVRIEPERRIEWKQFTKLGRKYQHD